MKRLVLFLLLGILGCATPPPPKSATLRTFPEKIDLNLVEMIPVRAMPTGSGKSDKDSSIEEIPIYENDNKEPYLFLNLKYADSGLNIIELIKRGEIIAHSIIVRNSKGEIIGEESINFTAFTRTETIVIEQGIVVSDDNSKNPIPELERKTSKESNFYPREYSDQDLIPQSISFLKKDFSRTGRKEPQEGEVISIYLELVYVNPFLYEYCLDSNAKCDSKRQELFREIAAKNQERLSAMQADMQKNVAVKFESSRNKQEKELQKRENSQSIRKSLDQANGSLFTNASPEGKDLLKVQDPKNPLQTVDGQYWNYREWNLVSVPRYFRIRGRVDKNGKPIGGEKKIVLPSAGSEPASESLFDHKDKDGEHSEPHPEENKKDPRRKRKELMLP